MMNMRSPLPSARNSRVRMIRVGDIAVDMICTPGSARMRTAHSSGESLMGSTSSFIDMRQQCSRHLASRSFSGRSAVEKRTVEKPSGFISVALLKNRADIGGINLSSRPLKRGGISGKKELFGACRERIAQYRRSKYGTSFENWSWGGRLIWSCVTTIGGNMPPTVQSRVRRSDDRRENFVRVVRIICRQAMTV